jgi:hypothetical protein
MYIRWFRKREKQMIRKILKNTQKYSKYSKIYKNTQKYTKPPKQNKFKREKNTY